MSTTTATLEQRLSQQVGDFIEVALTTSLTTSHVAVSTNLQSYDGGRDNAFNDWWCYVTDKANATRMEQVSAYTSSTGSLTLRGAVFVTDGTDKATIRLHRYNRDSYIQAINDTSRELPDVLFQNFDSKFNIITGNLLPNPFFRDWTVSTYPDKYGVTSATATANTTSTYLRGGAKSALVTASAGNGYMSINSNDYPRLLSIADHVVTLRCWANPEVADDASLVIYTLKADGTAQTLTSTTTCPAGYFTLLELANQTINDDLVYVSIRFKITTNGKKCYFTNARLSGVLCHEYLLSPDLIDVDSYAIQINGRDDYPCDDLFPQFGEPVAPNIISDGTDRFIQIPYVSENYLIRLKGTSPLSTVSGYADTIEIGEPQINLFIAYAKYKLFQKIKTPVAEADVQRYERELAEAYAEYQRLLPRLKMIKDSTPLRYV